MTKRVIATSPVETLVRRVKALIEKGDKAAEKAEQFYKSAGIHIKEIKQQSEDWETIVREQCNIGRSRAYELMAIADGRTTLEKVRANTNERQKVHKAKSQSVITDEKPEPVASRVTGSQEVGVEQHRARMAALDLDPEPTVEPAPVEAAVDEVERRVSCVTNTILRHIEGLSRGETERLLAALRSRIDEIERDVAEVVSLAEAALSDRAAIPADLSIPDCLKRTEAAA